MKIYSEIMLKCFLKIRCVCCLDNFRGLTDSELTSKNRKCVNSVLPAESTTILKFAIAKGKRGLLSLRHGNLDLGSWENLADFPLYNKVSLGVQQYVEVDESALDELFCLASAVESRDAVLGAAVCRYQPKLHASLDSESVLSKGYAGEKSAKVEVLLHPFCEMICAKNKVCWTIWEKKSEILEIMSGRLLYKQSVQFTSC